MHPAAAHASDQLFTWTVLAYALAMFGYSAEFAFTRIARTRGDEPRRAQRIGLMNNGRLSIRQDTRA